MNILKEKLFKIMTKAVTLLSMLLFAFIVLFIFNESIVVFKKIPIKRFLFGMKWNPIASPPKLSIFPMIFATVYVSIIALIIAIPIGVGCAVFISVFLDEKSRSTAKSVIDILAGIPSVVYGFFGLLVIVKFFEIKFSFSSGESVLAGGILLSIMILPYIISTCTESMVQIYETYCRASDALGVSRDYMIRNILLPQSKRSIFVGTILAMGRAMGETMAVMMVIGNAPVVPKLFGKCQTIPSLIALEMGMAQVGSLHYYSLFASGFVLMIILILMNFALYLFKNM